MLLLKNLNPIYFIFLNQLKKKRNFNLAKRVWSKTLIILNQKLLYWPLNVKIFLFDLLIIVWVLIKRAKVYISGKLLIVPVMFTFFRSMILSIKWICFNIRKIKIMRFQAFVIEFFLIKLKIGLTYNYCSSLTSSIFKQQKNRIYRF